MPAPAQAADHDVGLLTYAGRAVPSIAPAVALVVVSLEGAAGLVLLSAFALLALALLALADDDPAYVPPHSYGLPGMADGAPTVVGVGPRAPQTAVPLAAVVIVAVGVLSLPSVLAVVALLLAASVSWLRAAPMVMGRRHTARLRQALESYDPTIVLPYAGRSGGPWQLGAWEPYLLHSGERAVVINLHAKYAPLILREAGLESPVVQLGSRGTSELADLLVPSMRAAFYVQNADENDDFVSFAQLTHVWLGHGDSDKPGSSSATHARYDVLVVAGAAARERYLRRDVDIESDRFVALGRPQTAGIVRVDEPVRSVAEPVVLYAPTWQGVDPLVDFSSLDDGVEIVRGLIGRGAVVVFRPHPLSYRWRTRRARIHEVRQALREDRERTGRLHRWGGEIDHDLSIAELANRSDALVTDVSAVASDWLASGKPYAMTTREFSVEQMREDHPVAGGALVLLGDLSNLDDVLDQLLVEDPLVQERDRVRRHVLGDFTGEESADAFADFVRTLVADPGDGLRD